jgi:hypothetical protein
VSDESNNNAIANVSDGPEYRVLANLFGVMLGLAGLLAGTMLREGSVDYWQHDLVPLLILLITGRGLLKSSMDLLRESMVYADKKQMVDAFLSKQAEVLPPEPGEMARLATKSHYSEEERWWKRSASGSSNNERVDMPTNWMP